MILRMFFEASGGRCDRNCDQDGSQLARRGETRRDHARSVGQASEANELQRRRAKTTRGLLITQRSQVQILPPLPNQQVRGLSRFREGPSCCVLCTGDRALSLLVPGRTGLAETCSGDLRQRGTHETFLSASLGAWPRGGKRLRTPHRRGLWLVANVNCWFMHEAC
jgi:hypothetical protein